MSLPPSPRHGRLEALMHSAPDRSGLSRQELARFSRQHARLLSRAANGFGLAGCLTALVNLAMASATWVPLTAVAVALIVLLAGCMILLNRHESTPLVIGLFATAALIVVVLGIGQNGVLRGPTLDAALAICAWGLGGAVTALVSSWGRILSAIGGLFLLLPCLLIFMGDFEPMVRLNIVIFVITCWGICATIGLWLATGFAKMVRQVDALAEAYRLERHASDIEAQRHSDARLLHDTALATLTMLAHAGAGVSHRALRDQAAADAELLARLRLGESPAPTASGDYVLTGTTPGLVGDELVALRERFLCSGLEVHWYGVSDLSLTGSARAALFLALSESLTNVERHAGVQEASVTLSDNGVAVRAVITDTGVGFDPAAVPAERLGFRESVVGRIRDEGGSVRLFSTPGAGTTVVLEVPV